MMMLFVGASAVLLGLAVAVALLLGHGRQNATVAHSLALIEEGVRPHEMARQDLPAAERLAKPFFRWSRGLALALSPKGTTARITRLLDLAGNPRGWPSERVLGFKGALLLLGAAIGLLVGHLGLIGIVLALGFGFFGFFLPDLLIYNAGQKRQQELRRGLADAMDMLTVCIQAGQGFDAALQQVANSVTGPVAGEFARVIQEIGIGKSRAAVFAGLGNRSKVDEIKTLVTAIVQADRLGIPIGNVLHEQADQMRLRRRQHAEEQAQKVPIKILFPMMMFIFPALMIVVVGPGAIQLMRAFGKL